MCVCPPYRSTVRFCFYFTSWLCVCCWLRGASRTIICCCKQQAPINGSCVYNTWLAFWFSGEGGSTVFSYHVHFVGKLILPHITRHRQIVCCTPDLSYSHLRIYELHISRTPTWSIPSGKQGANDVCACTPKELATAVAPCAAVLFFAVDVEGDTVVFEASRPFCCVELHYFIPYYMPLVKSASVSTRNLWFCSGSLRLFRFAFCPAKVCRQCHRRTTKSAQVSSLKKR